MSLVARFEDCTLPAGEFHHAGHVRVAWEYLREEPSLVDALRRFAVSLRRFAEHHGQATLYHETITWAYVALIHERMLFDPGADWPAFARANGDLLTWKPSILERYYTHETLFSDLARRTFLLPDRVVEEPASSASPR